MTDIERLIKEGKKFADWVSRILELCTPRLSWDEKQLAWRHDTNHNKLTIFLLTKLSGSVSTTNAMLKLAEQGFWFQAAILARSIRESNLAMAFMLPKPNSKKSDWPSKHQEDSLTEFFKETWSDPEHPFEDDKQRSQINLRNLSASLGHFQPKNSKISKHDAGQAAVQTMRFLSDYTHMAYPQVMELFEPHRGYVLCGGQKGPTIFDIRIVASVFFDTCNWADNVTILMERTMKGAYDLACTKKNQRTADILQVKLSEIQNLQDRIENLCKETEKEYPVTTPDPKKLLKKFKDK